MSHEYRPVNLTMAETCAWVALVGTNWTNDERAHLSYVAHPTLPSATKHRFDAVTAELFTFSELRELADLPDYYLAEEG